MDPRLVPKDGKLWTENFRKRKITAIAAICGKVTAQKREIQRCWTAVKEHLANSTEETPPEQTLEQEREIPPSEHATPTVGGPGRLRGASPNDIRRCKGK